MTPVDCENVSLCGTIGYFYDFFSQHRHKMNGGEPILRVNVWLDVVKYH